MTMAADPANVLTVDSRTVNLSKQLNAFRGTGHRWADDFHNAAIALFKWVSGEYEDKPTVQTTRPTYLKHLTYPILSNLPSYSATQPQAKFMKSNSTPSNWLSFLVRRIAR